MNPTYLIHEFNHSQTGAPTGNLGIIDTRSRGAIDESRPHQSDAGATTSYARPSRIRGAERGIDLNGDATDRSSEPCATTERSRLRRRPNRHQCTLKHPRATVALVHQNR